MNKFNSKDVCIFLGVMFGLLIFISVSFAIPSSLLLIIGAIQTFEFSNKKKKTFEDHLNYKLKNFEEIVNEFKKENDKIKTDFENIKSKMNVAQMYGGRHQ